MIIPTAEPFFFPGGNIGCLLVHGFTGAPKEMRWMGEYLAERGHTVLAPRLAGHATRPEDLPRTRWGDWLDSVEDGWHILGGAASQDGGDDPENMPKIYRDLGCTDKAMLWIENSGHVLTRDAARGQVFKAADDFIRRVSET